MNAQDSFTVHFKKILLFVLMGILLSVISSAGLSNTPTSKSSLLHIWGSHVVHDTYQVFGSSINTNASSKIAKHRRIFMEEAQSALDDLYEPSHRHLTLDDVRIFIVTALLAGALFRLLHLRNIPFRTSRTGYAFSISSRCSLYILAMNFRI